MNHKTVLIVCLVLVALGMSVMIVDAQGPKPTPPKPKAPTANAGTAFTYQGQLKKNGALVSSTCNFLFGLWDDDILGNQVGSTQTVSSLAVTNGLFTTPIGFGNNAFTGDARWLQTLVQCTGDGSYTSLNPRQALTLAPMALSLPGLYTYQNATSPNIIGGYSGNVVSNTVVGGTIGGGGASGYPNRVWADHATIGGGSQNTASNQYATIGGGQANTIPITGIYTTISGGWSNTASGWAATVGGGQANTASSDYATVGGGIGNTATSYATVPGGWDASATHFGEMAYASGAFATIGDAQSSLYVLRDTTTNATQTELFLDGYSERISIAPTRTLSFEILVTARSDTGESAGYRIRGVIENVGGTTSLLVGASGEVLGSDDGTWSAIAAADNVNDALVVKVTGAASKTIRWVAVVRTAEVAY